MHEVLSNLPISGSEHMICARNMEESSLDATLMKEVLAENLLAFRRRCLTRIDYIRYNAKVQKIFFWGLLLSYGTVSKKVCAPPAPLTAGTPLAAPACAAPPASMSLLAF